MGLTHQLSPTFHPELVDYQERLAQLVQPQLKPPGHITRSHDLPAPSMRSSLTPSNIRLDVVTLLCDADFRRRPDAGRRSHRDGRAFTKAEQSLAFSATRKEFEVAAAQIKREGDYLSEYEDAVEALPKLLLPYLAQLGNDGTVADVLPLLSAEDRAEFERLRDILAPDGWLYAPTDE